MQGERRHGTLITDIQNDIVVDVQTVVEPLDLRCEHRQVPHLSHQIAAMGLQLTIMLIQIVAARVGKKQGPFIGAVDIGKIGGIGIGTGPCHCLVHRKDV